MEASWRERGREDPRDPVVIIRQELDKVLFGRNNSDFARSTLGRGDTAHISRDLVARLTEAGIIGTELTVEEVPDVED